MSSLLHIAEKFINQSNKNVFLTGKAGTGKTTFLRSIVQSTHKKLVVVAPTGIAAINAEGVTIHSMFQLPFGAHLPVEDFPMQMGARITNRNYIRKNIKLGAQKQKLLRELELLIIDEASMVRSDLLDLIDFVLRFIRRKRNLPFGGVQVLFVGDLLQLPPVVKSDEWMHLKEYYSSPFFFDAQVLRDNPPVYIELDKVYRQQDQQFIDLLNHFREDKVTKTDLDLLNQYHRPDFESTDNDEYILLTTHNHKAEAINQKKINDLNENSYRFNATVSGDFKENSYPHPEALEFKIGAQVMFVKNDPSGEQKFFNGRIGKIVRLSTSEIEVGFKDQVETVIVEKYQWENIKFELDPVSNEITEKVVGTYTTYPIKLAWAITVHKSQGLTFDKAILDLEGAFAVGQVYVALSRLRSLDGLVLKSKVNLSSVEQNKQVADYTTGSKLGSDRLEKIADESARMYLKDYLIDVFDFAQLIEDLKDHVISYKAKKKKTTKEEFAGWAMDLFKKVEQIQPPAIKFQGQINRIVGEGAADYLSVITERVKAAQNYFAPQFKTLSDEVFAHIDAVKKLKITKTYLKELMDLELAFYDRQMRFQKALALCDSLIANTLLTKENIEALEEEDREEQLSKAAVKKKTGVKGGGRKGATEKGLTKKISFDAYKEGKTVEEIAKERELTVQTIEGHLAHYVGTGDLDVLDFVEMHKLQLVRKAVEKLETSKFGELKAELGSKATYTDIRFTLASLK